MRTGLLVIASVGLLAALTGLAVSRERGKPFTFAGFQRDLDLVALIDRYPRSSHEISPGADAPKRRSEDDLKVWFREFVRLRGSGTYILRMTPEEASNHVYYVQAQVRRGITERLWLSFEKPLEMIRHRRRWGNEERYPACSDLLRELTARYGKPDVLPPRREEALEVFNHFWTHLSDAMTLECGRYSGRKFIFATSVVFEEAISH
jgi:hypothetical protein